MKRVSSNTIARSETHQRQSGYWYTRTPKITDVLSNYAGTAYVVTALRACGEIRRRDFA